MPVDSSGKEWPMAMILIPAILLHFGLLGWFIKKVYLPKFYIEVAPGEATGRRYRLASGVRSVLSILHGFAFFAVIAWIPFWVVMLVSQFGNADWGIDLDVYSGFRIDVDQRPSVEATGLRDSVITGETKLAIDTSNRLAWFLFSSSNLFASILVVYVLLQLRNIFVYVSRGDAFTLENASRLKRISVAVIAGYLAEPLLQYLGWGAVLESITFNSGGIELFPAYRVNVVGVLIGLGAFVLSGVIAEAVELKEEQRLTI
jgi:hypothetical protein